MDSTFFFRSRWTSPRQISPQSVHCTGGGIAPEKVDVFAHNALSCKVCDKRLCHQGFEFRIVLMSMDIEVCILCTRFLFTPKSDANEMLAFMGVLRVCSMHCAEFGADW